MKTKRQRPAPLRLDSPLAGKRWQSRRAGKAALIPALCCRWGPVARSPLQPLLGSLRPCLSVRAASPAPGADTMVSALSRGRLNTHTAAGPAWLPRGNWPCQWSLAQGLGECTTGRWSSLAVGLRPWLGRWERCGSRRGLWMPLLAGRSAVLHCAAASGAWEGDVWPRRGGFPAQAGPAGVGD